MRSELNTEQRRVGLAPATGWKRTATPHPDMPRNDGGFPREPAQRALTQRDKGVPSTPPPRRPVPEKLPPSPDDFDAAAPSLPVAGTWPCQWRREPARSSRHVSGPNQSRLSRRITTAPAVRACGD